MTDIADGMIAPDSEAGLELGFTSVNFDGWLWKMGPRMMISMIVSRYEGKGNLSALFKAIEDRGLTIAVPTPFARMASILERKGFKPHMEESELGPCEVWTRA